LAESSLADKELLNQFRAIEKMNDKDKSVVKVFLDAFITKGKLKQLVLKIKKTTKNVRPFINLLEL